MRTTTTIATQLLGKTVKPKDWGDKELTEDQTKKMWNWAKPIDTGFRATIQAVWIDSDGNTKALLSDPTGSMKEMWLEHTQLV